MEIENEAKTATAEEISRLKKALFRPGTAGRRPPLTVQSSSPKKAPTKYRPAFALMPAPRHLREESKAKHQRIITLGDSPPKNTRKSILPDGAILAAPAAALT